MLVLVETSAHPQTVRGFRPRAPWTTVGNDTYGIEGRSPREIEAQRFKVPLAHREWLSALPVVMRLVVDGAPYWIAHAGVPLSLAVGIDPVRRMREILPEHHCDSRWSALDQTPWTSSTGR